jgi:pimeloyl-ACP methyl ester carboxylesterase
MPPDTGMWQSRRMAPTNQITRGNLAFNVTESGPRGGEPVLLLHGFPQHADSWDALAPLLNDAGYRTIAMDQRGYSPGARPLSRSAYRVPELVADTAAVVDHYGGPVHLVGHDWGAVAAWAFAAAHPERTRSLTALSVPHPAAFLRAMVTSRQCLRSWYMVFFQLPWLPEWALRHGMLRWFLEHTGQTPERARRDVEGLAGPGALTGALNWYRALPLLDPRRTGDPVRSPTLFIWSDGDIAVDRRGAEDCARYVQAPYQFETLTGVSHWIPEEAPRETAALLLPHLKRTTG